MTIPEKHTSSYSPTDILQYLLNSGTIDIDDVATNMEKEKKFLTSIRIPLPREMMVAIEPMSKERKVKGGRLPNLVTKR